MGFTAIGASVTGHLHVRSSLPCQDVHRIRNGDPLVIAVADGHGSSSCPYSSDGADVAVRAFCDTFDELHHRYGGDLGGLHQFLSRNRDDLIPKKIAQSWLEQVEMRHHERKRVEGFESLLYGTTLVGMVITDTFCFAMQLGDGDILAVGCDGAVSRVIQAERILGTETQSLSSPEAWRHMLSGVHYIANGNRPALFMLSTDGLSNSFASDEEFLQTATDYLALLREHGEGVVRENLSAWLTETSEFGCGDDIALVLAFDQTLTRDSRLEAAQEHPKSQPCQCAAVAPPEQPAEADEGVGAGQDALAGPPPTAPPDSE